MSEKLAARATEPPELRDDEIFRRLPAIGVATHHFGDALVVPERRSAVIFAGGACLDVLPPGGHHLDRATLPRLTAALAVRGDADAESFRAALVFVNREPLADQGWGTRHPTTYRDPELGPALIRAHGTYSFRVHDPARLVETLHRQHGLHTSPDAKALLSSLISARLHAVLRSHVSTLKRLPAERSKVVRLLREQLTEDMVHWGIELGELRLDRIVLPDAARAVVDGDSNVGRGQALAGDTPHNGRRLPLIQFASDARLGIVLDAVRVQPLSHEQRSIDSVLGPRHAARPDDEGHLTTDPRLAPDPQPATLTGAGPSCADCGNPLPPRARFCPGCGCRLEESP